MLGASPDGEMMVELTTTTFATVVTHGRVLVSWYRCGPPWRAFAPIYQEAARRHPRVVFARVDAENEHELAARCGIECIPTLMAFRDGALLLIRAGFDVAESLDVAVRRVQRRLS
jgi:thioredoxin-like negative regulator of GroEL